MTFQDESVDRLRECPLCCSTAWKRLPVPGRWIGEDVFGKLAGTIGLTKCRRCGLVFTNPRPSGQTLSRFYSGDTYCCHALAGSASSGVKADYLLQRVAAYLPRDAPRTLLDYGAGGGGFLSRARERGWDVWGFEPGRRGLESCRSAGLRVSDRWEDLPAGAFGLVTLHHVLEHLPNPIEVLADLRGRLAADGRLLVEVPNARSLRARLAAPWLCRRFGADERYRAYPIHLMYYSSRTLRQMLETSGWAVETMFTAGLGIDELFVPSAERRGRPDGPEVTGPSGRENGIARLGERPWRHGLRAAFLGLGAGENLAVIASAGKIKK